MTRRVVNWAWLVDADAKTAKPTMATTKTALIEIGGGDSKFRKFIVRRPVGFATVSCPSFISSYRYQLASLRGKVDKETAWGFASKRASCVIRAAGYSNLWFRF